MGVVAVYVKKDTWTYKHPCALQKADTWICGCRRLLYNPHVGERCRCGAVVVEVVEDPPVSAPSYFPPFDTSAWDNMIADAMKQNLRFGPPPPPPCDAGAWDDFRRRAARAMQGMQFPPGDNWVFPRRSRQPYESKEDRERREAVHGQSGPQLTAMAALQKKGTPMVYNLRIQSPCVLTQTKVKSSLGTGFTILSIEVEKDTAPTKIEDVDGAVKAIVQAGYRALARAYHPDLGGSTETMATINRAKKELTELLESLKA